MDKKIKILLNSERNVESVNVDTFNKIALMNDVSEIQEYELRNAISETQQYEIERQETEIYRIYGKLNYVSLLNGLRSDYGQIGDFFDKRKFENEKDVFNTFKFYLAIPSNIFVEVIGTTQRYGRKFEIIATPNEFQLMDAGFSKNVFNEQEYSFIFDIDFDISGKYDYLNFPITEFFLYAEYQPSSGAEGNEMIERFNWEAGGIITEQYTPIDLEIGDLIIGDVVEYSARNYLQAIDTNQKYVITTPISGTSGNIDIKWEYNPFIKLNARYLQSTTTKANKDSTSYDQQQSIPDHAIDLGGGNMVWREILPQGIDDNITGDGANFPFVNKRRYLFANEVLLISPDLTDQQTLNVFEEINFGEEPITISNLPITDIDNIGSPC